VLEKLLLWRHCHTENCEVHDRHEQAHDQGRSGALIVVGDTIHNFVDGVLIAAAFMNSTELGIVAAAAIIAHEIPQEVGDFLILLHSGYSRRQALALNLLSSLATLVGGVLGYTACSTPGGGKRRSSASLGQAWSTSRWPISSPACTAARNCATRLSRRCSSPSESAGLPQCACCWRTK
jgi:ZIP Zinc transporter